MDAGTGPMNRKTIFVLIGQTASGKKEILEHLYKQYKCLEFISADSRKIYKYLNIGTDKPTGELRKKMHLIDIITPDMLYSAQQFRQDAETAIEKILEKGKIPIMTAGTPLYLLSIFKGFFPSQSNAYIRAQLDKREEEKGKVSLYNELKHIDPERATKLHPNDSFRVKRALEIFYSTGKTYTYWTKQNIQPIYRGLYFGIKWTRAHLYERIEHRVEAMFERGLIREVQRLLDMGYSTVSPGLATIGYKEVIPYIMGEYNREECIRLIKKHTKVYARRQEYFFKHFKEVNWFKVDSDITGVLTPLYREVDKYIKNFYYNCKN